MKRIIALLICVTATLCLFSCKGDDNEKGGETEKTNEKNETVSSTTKYPWGDKEIILPEDELQ